MPTSPNPYDLDRELADLQGASDEQRAGATPYREHPLRRPAHPLVAVGVLRDPEAVEATGPVFGPADVAPLDHDLTRQHTGEASGERISVSGRLLDSRGRPVAGQLIEVWQANASGRYAHQGDRHPAPLDPHFTGYGRLLTDAAGRYRLITVKPGPYPLGGPGDGWRAAHIHFSVFGTAFTQRLVTQMYFQGDPLLAHDSVPHAVADPAARQRLVAAYDPALSRPEDSTSGYRWDIVVDGPSATWREASAAFEDFEEFKGGAR